MITITNRERLSVTYRSGFNMTEKEFFDHYRRFEAAQEDGKRKEMIKTQKIFGGKKKTSKILYTFYQTEKTVFKRTWPNFYRYLREV
jgi:hypothetical protein